MLLPFSRRKLLTTSAWALLAGAAHQPLYAQASGKVIRLIVPFAPGGGNDVFARQMAQGLGEQFKRNIIVENRPGAGGNLGTEFVARAAADGTTLLLGHTGTVSINPALYQGLKFNAATDLQPLAMFASSALLLVVPDQSPYKDVRQLAQALRTDQSRHFTYASSGSGTGGHLTGELFVHDLQAHATHVPYKGTAPSLTDLAGGVVDFSFGVIPSAMSLVKAGKLRALAITSSKRHALLPNVPTVAESGVPELAKFESTLTYGILGPTGLPADTVKTLGSQILQVAAMPAFQSKLGVEGAEPLLGDAAAYEQRMRAENAKWAAIIKDSKVQI